MAGCNVFWCERFKDWRIVLARRLRLGASGVKRTARGRRNGRRHVALQQYPRRGVMRVRDRNGGN